MRRCYAVAVLMLPLRALLFLADKIKKKLAVEAISISDFPVRDSTAMAVIFYALYAPFVIQI